MKKEKIELVYVLCKKVTAPGKKPKLTILKVIDVPAPQTSDMEVGEIARYNKITGELS